MSGDFKLGILIGLLILALMVIFLTNKPRAEEPQTDSASMSDQKELFIPEDPASTGGYQVATVGGQTTPPSTSWSAADDTTTTPDNVVVITKNPPQDLISNAHMTGLLSQTDTLGQVETTSDVPAEGPPAAKTLAPGAAAVEESTFPVSHVVAKGETLSTISAKYYGTHKYYRHIRKANPTTIPHVDALRIGQKIQIPAPPEEARTVAVAPKAETPKAPADPAATPSSIPRTHKVKKGESLCHISRTYYNGSETMWPKILQANRSRIRDPKRLQVGTELVIPAI